MSYTIIYRMITAKTEEGKFALFAEVGCNNVWGYSYNGKWQRDRGWRYIGTYADATEAYATRFIRNENIGVFQAQRGKLVNMITRAFKKATTPENIMKCEPTACWHDFNEECTEMTHRKVNLTKFSEIAQYHQDCKNVLLNGRITDNLYNYIKSGSKN